MAARINTKFVIILAVALVVLTGGGVLAVMQLNKSAEEYAKSAQKEIAKAEQALAEGSPERADAMFMRAANDFQEARARDKLNNEHLYNYIDVNKRISIADMTLAQNQTRNIIAAAVNIHDTPNASDNDREYLYELLSDFHRMRPALNNIGALANINEISEKRLSNYPNDPVAIKWRAVIEGYRVETETEAEKRAEMLATINQALQANPDDPRIINTLARYHIANARRQYRANGNTYSEEVVESFASAERAIRRSLELSKEDPVRLFETAKLLFDIRSDDKETAATLAGQGINAANALRRLLDRKEMRDQLYTEELSRIIGLYRLIRSGTEEHPFDGNEAAEALAKTIASERSDDPAAHTALGSLYFEQREFAKSESAFEDGLKIERRVNAIQFARDEFMRTQMTSTLAEAKIHLAAAAQDLAQRDVYLEEANQLVKNLEQSAIMTAEANSARVAYLSGFAAIVKGRPAEAVSHLERANQAYLERDPNTLRYLAQSHMHRKLRNTAKAIEIYEKLVALQPATPLRLNLINLYIAQRNAEQNRLAAGHLDQFLTRFPNNITGIRLKANLLSQENARQEAIALLQQADPDGTNEQIQADIDRYLAQEGDTEGFIEKLRLRLTDQPEGEQMNLALVIQLINLIPEVAAKNQELDRLIAAGLDETTGKILKGLIETGELSLEQEVALLESRGLEPAQQAMQKYLLYVRRNQTELADQQFALAKKLGPKLPQVVEYRYRNALEAQDWNEALQATEDMLDLGLDERPEIAIADGAFMRARVVAAQAVAIQDQASRLSKLREAASSYEQALKSYPAYADGWLQLGRIQLLLDNNYTAQSNLREALNLKSRDLEILKTLARAEVRSGDLTEAIGRYEKVLEIDPSDQNALDQFSALAVQTDQALLAITARERVRDDLRPNDTRNRRALAMLYARDLSFANARRELEAVIAIEGRSLENMSALVQVLAMNKQMDEAVAATKSYIAERGDQADWRDQLLLAQTYEQAEQSQEADVAFAKAIEEAGDNRLTASIAWGVALQQRGALNRAIELFESLAADFPENNALKTQAAQLLIQAEAFDRAEALTQSLPASAERYVLLIQSALGKEQTLGLAIRRARDGVRAYPDSYRLRMQLCRLILNQQQRRPAEARDFDELLRLAEAVTRDYPDRIDPKVIVADALLGQQKIDQAVQRLESILEVAPTHTGSNERLFNIRIIEARQVAATDPESSQDKAAQALSIMTQLIRAQPASAILKRNAAQAATLAGLSTQATNYYRQAFNQSKEAEDLNGYASALLQQNRGADALAVLQDPDNATLLSNNLMLRALRGQALAVSGSPDKAVALFKNAFNTNKQDPQARQMLTLQAARAFRDEADRLTRLIDAVYDGAPPQDVDDIVINLLIDRKRFKESAERLARYEGKQYDDPNDEFNMLQRLALSRQEAGSIPEAKAAYDRALSVFDRHPGSIAEEAKAPLLNNYAFLLAQHLPGYESLAVSYAKQALELMGENASQENIALVQDTYGWALFKAGKVDEAIEQLRRSIDRYPVAANQLHLGRAYLSEGDNNKALVHLDAALNQAKADNNEQLTREAQKYYKQALTQTP